jgi:UDP-3-O-[3-hydroxymyristoyl] glucosamine N-acyltransferase
MTEPLFFKSAKSLTIAEIAALTGAEAGPQALPGRRISGVAPLDTATPRDLAFLDNPRYLDQIGSTRAGACLVAPRLPRRRHSSQSWWVRDRTGPQRSRRHCVLPVRRGQSRHERSCNRAAGERVARSRRRRRPRREIGTGTVVGPNAVVGPEFACNCSVGPGAADECAGRRSRIIHPAFASPGRLRLRDGADGTAKVPQIGRVIIQTTWRSAPARPSTGGTRDTVIGGTGIDNLRRSAKCHHRPPSCWSRRPEFQGA